MFGLTHAGPEAEGRGLDAVRGKDKGEGEGGVEGGPVSMSETATRGDKPK